MRHDGVVLASRTRATKFAGALCALFLFMGVFLQTSLLRASDLDPAYRLSSLRVFNRVVLLVKEQYVEPSRINPQEMFIAALEAVEKRVPEILVEEPKAKRLGVVVGGDRREFMLDDLGTLWELSFRLREVFRFIEVRV